MIESLFVVAAAFSQAEVKEKKDVLPLETTRRIEFETDEATWLSLDVSPDGNTLVLEIAGDLYTLPIGGGEARAFLTGPPFESQPRFSPDGKWIAFLSDRTGAENVWIAKPDGSEAKKLSDDKDAEFASPDWSADGTQLVYSRPATAPPCIGGFCGSPGVDSASLEVITRNGAGWAAPQTLVAFGGQNNYYPTYSPDNQWVMFNRSPSNANSFDAPDALVWLVSAAGGNAIQLATASTGGDSWPKWAPDVQPYRGGQIMWFTFSSRHRVTHPTSVPSLNGFA